LFPKTLARHAQRQSKGHKHRSFGDTEIAIKRRKLMLVKLSDREVRVRAVYDTNKAGRYILVRNMMNMSGDLAHEDCYDPRLKGNSDPLHVYRKGYRTWLLSEAALTSEEQELALKLAGQRPRHLDSLLSADCERHDDEEAEIESEEHDEDESETEAIADATEPQAVA
jgi:hypothetical protein